MPFELSFRKDLFTWIFFSIQTHQIQIKTTPAHPEMITLLLLQKTYLPQRESLALSFWYCNYFPCVEAQESMAPPFLLLPSLYPLTLEGIFSQLSESFWLSIGSIESRNDFPSSQAFFFFYLSRPLKFPHQLQTLPLLLLRQPQKVPYKPLPYPFFHVFPPLSALLCLQPIPFENICQCSKTMRRIVS